jgi:D-alanyl-D-alanine carboxypeptidase
MTQTIAYIIGILALCTGCGKYMTDLSTQSCKIGWTSAPGYSKAEELEKVLDELTHSGVPGVVLAVQSKEGLWTASRGYAKIEDKKLMEPCHLQYLQSVSKTYLAVAILKLYEQGKIDLDQNMLTYLPKRYHQYITDGNMVTVRMLLNHTSGIPEYNFAPGYVAYLLQHPMHHFTTENYLGYIKGKKLLFTPGSKHVYCNTNYELLALIVDSISGDHSKLISEIILKPLHLVHTFYRNDSGYLRYPTLVNSYWDRYDNGILENISLMQRANVGSLIGDDGIVSTATDAVTFLKALFDGRLLSATTMQQMETWVKNKKGKPVYGLGLAYREIDGVKGYGHSGGGIGAGCELYFFPEKDLYYFIAINLGTVTDSPIHAAVGKALENMYKILLKD